MKFVRVQELAEAVAPLRDRLTTELSAGKNVLWLLSGGSLIAIETSVMQQLDDSLTNRLTVMLMDERYDGAGHLDSNDQKLATAGFDPKHARWIRVLQDGLSLDETARHFANEAERAFHQADIIVGLFGMGTNGHVAGIQPRSSAVSSADFATSFIWTDFQRLTLTPRALTGVTVAFLVACGTDKRPALETLRTHDIPIDEQPAQLLKQIPDAYIFNDQIGDKS